MVPKSLLFLFTDDQKLITIATPLAQIIMVGLPFLAILSVGTAFFQSIGKATPALVIWIARQAILLIPLILILAKYGVVSLFFAFPIADVIGALIVLLLVLYQIRKWNVRTETVITH
jgi:Na+-driven multidrug efflux pump